MQINIAGKQMDLGEALKQKITNDLEAVVSKYCERTGQARVTVSKQGHMVEVDCNIHLPSGILLQAKGQATDPYASLENALDKIEKRIRRYRRRLKDHHRPDRSPFPSEPAIDHVLSSVDESDEELTDEKHVDENSVLTIAETSTTVHTMAVSEAVMQLELSDVPALMFRHAATKRHNMVYRRVDGHIGWVDPSEGSP